MVCTTCSMPGKAAEAITGSRLLINMRCGGDYIYPFKKCDVACVIGQEAVLKRQWWLALSQWYVF